jgi:hypothetical protein
MGRNKKRPLPARAAAFLVTSGEKILRCNTRQIRRYFALPGLYARRLRLFRLFASLACCYLAGDAVDGVASVLLTP